MFRELKYKIDLYKHLNIKIEHCKQNDDINLIIEVFKNGISYDVQNLDINCRFDKADNKIVLIDSSKISMVNNTITIECVKDCTRSAGMAEFEVVLKNDGKEISTFTSRVYIEKSVFNGQEESKNIATIIEDLTIANDAGKKTLADINEAGEKYKDVTIIQERVNDLEKTTEKHNAFDIRELTETYITQLEMSTGNICQGLAIDSEKIEFYTAQSDNASEESPTITRHDKNGNRLDSCLLNLGGHGGQIALENDNGKIYIWMCWANNTIGKKLTRTLYQGGKTFSFSDSTVQKFDTEIDYCLPAISPDNKLILLRFLNSKDVETFKIYDLAKFKAGDRTPLYTFSPNFTRPTLQGLAIDDQYFYYRGGDTNAVTELDNVKIYDYKKGVWLNNVYPSLITDIEGANYREPEGIATYMDKATGKKGLFLITMNGGVSRRNAKVTMYGALGLAEIFVSYQLQKHQPYSLMNAKGEGKPIPAYITKLEQIVSPGWYYIEAGESANLSDHPDPKNGGWLFVSPQNLGNNKIYQEYTRNTNASDNIFKVTRMVEISEYGTVGRATTDWRGTSRAVTLWSGDSRGNTLNATFRLSETINNFDYLYIAYNHPAGGNVATQWFKVSELASNTIPFNYFNITDTESENPVSLFEHSITFNEARDEFTIDRRNKVNIGVGAPTYAADDKTVGVRKIIGINI